VSDNDLDRVLRSYTQVAKERKLSKMTKRRCEISSQLLPSVEQVWAILREVSAPVGWLGFQSGNLLLDGSRPATEAAALGMLIDAELAVKAKSIHVRYRGDGWIVTTYTPNVGAEFLSDEVSLLTTNGALTYERLWSLDPDLGMRQVHARLVVEEVSQ
jgi:hypothetical protein